MATPGKQETKSKVKTMGNEGGGCAIKFREPCPPSICPIPEECPPEGRPPPGRPPEGRPPDRDRDRDRDRRVIELLEAIVEGQKGTIGRLETLVKAAEVELVDLKFDTGIQTLTNAVAAEPEIDNVSATGYTQQFIFPILQRLSPELYVINLGPGTIFLRVSKNGHDFSLQSPVFEGEVKTFYDVFEIRLRSPTAQTQYLITEFEYFKQKDISFLSGRPFVDEGNVVLGVPVIELIVTDPVQGLGRNAHTGFIVNDGPNNLQVELSNDGVNFAPIITVIPNQILDLDKEDMYTIRLSAAAGNANYRLAVH